MRKDEDQIKEKVVQDILQPHFNSILPVLLMVAKPSNNEEMLISSSYIAMRDAQIASLTKALEILESNSKKDSISLIEEMIDDLKMKRITTNHK